MIAEHKIMVDGIVYEKGETIPDFGSIDVVSNSGGKRSYQGLSKDIFKLPTIATIPKYKGNLKSGSSFLAVDTSDVYLYQGSEDMWYKL